MPAEVPIKQFELAERDAVLAFLREAYSNDPRKSDPDVWNWRTLENPHTELHDIPLWIAKDGERVVGQVSAIPIELNVAGEAQRAIWVVELVVLPEYRGRGLGKNLMLAARNYGPPVCALGFNELSGPILLALNWKPLGPMVRQQKLLFPGNALKEFASLAPIRATLNALYAPFRPLAPNQQGFKCIKVEKFDESFDDLWRRARGQWPCAVSRSARFLDWQFKKQPGKKFEVFGLSDATNLLGYVVLFFRKSEQNNVVAKVALTDICYDATYGAELVAALIDAALREAVARKAGTIVTDILDERVLEQLRKRGFWQVKPRASFMIYDPSSRQAVYEKRNWFLTRADSDVSIFEDANL